MLAWLENELRETFEEYCQIQEKGAKQKMKCYRTARTLAKRDSLTLIIQLCETIDAYGCSVWYRPSTKSERKYITACHSALAIGIYYYNDYVLLIKF